MILQHVFYEITADENDSNYKTIIQYFILHELILCKKLNSLVAHMFSAWSFSHNIAVTIANNMNKYYLSLNKHTTVFSWGYGN